MFLISNTFSYLFFVKAYCADAIASCQKCTPAYQSTIFASKTHDFGSIFSFQKIDGMHHGIFGRNGNTKVDIVGHRVPFYNLYSFDASPLLDLIYDNLFLSPINLLLVILGDPNGMVFKNFKLNVVMYE